MRKTLIAASAAVLLLAAVILTAGCVASSDPLEGVWYQQEGNAYNCLVFEGDGAGYFAYLADESNPSDTSYAIPVVRKMERDNVYALQFPDGGEPVLITVNQAKGIITTGDGDVYMKIPSAVSGTTKDDLGLQAKILGKLGELGL